MKNQQENAIITFNLQDGTQCTLTVPVFLNESDAALINRARMAASARWEGIDQNSFVVSKRYKF